MSDVSIFRFGFASSSSMLAFCAAVSGSPGLRRYVTVRSFSLLAVFIESPFMSSYLASRDDPNHLIFVFLREGMHNQQKQNLCGQANRMPAFLAVHIPVRKHYKARIVENQRRCLKRHLVFPVILPGLLRVPIKAHVHRLYTIVYTNLSIVQVKPIPPSGVRRCPTTHRQARKFPSPP